MTNIIDDIDEEIATLTRKKKNIQDGCPHFIADTNWVMSEDDYGVESGPGTYYHTCKLCHKRFTTTKNPYGTLGVGQLKTYEG